jgi:hypothetical protein
MSSFVGGNFANGSTWPRTPHEEVKPIDFRWDVKFSQSYENPIWPGSTLYGTNWFLGDTLKAVKFEIAVDIPFTGNQGRKIISGVTRDANGARLDGVSLELWDSNTYQLLDVTTSDSFGNYRFNTPVATACFVLASKGSLVGTTLQTLTGV